MVKKIVVSDIVFSFFFVLFFVIMRQRILLLFLYFLNGNVILGQRVEISMALKNEFLS